MKLWGGRFTKATDKAVDDFNSSIRFDARLFEDDINGSIAHTTMLGAVGVIKKEEAERICEGLKEVKEDIKSGRAELLIDAEDIHMNVEKLLTEKIGPVGKKLHTGRSRNDQVALDIRLYIKREIGEIKELLSSLLNVLVKRAEENLDTIMPGYTHLQKAQPITLAHHFCAYIEMFKRDILRLNDTFKRVDVMPLGSGALAGTTYPLDRNMVKDILGFSSITLNSLDGVSDRDFIIELCSDISIIMMHLSRFCEELILWSSNEFSFVEMDDAYSTGSSIMPQKKNPDVAELIRGKVGRVYGDLTAILTVMKGIPLAYNKDMQEDKECVFDAIDTVKLCLDVFTKMVSTMTINKEEMLKGASKGFTNATDAADYLVKKGVAFRDAHEIIGKMVLYAGKNNKAIDELTLDELKECSLVFDEDVYEAISLKTCVNDRKIIGGPAKEAVLFTLNECREFLKNN